MPHPLGVPVNVQPQHSVLLLLSRVSWRKKKEQGKVDINANTSFILLLNSENTNSQIYIPPGKRLEDSFLQKLTKPGKKDTWILNNWEGYDEMAQQDHPV